jgi:hypothetical protein
VPSTLAAANVPRSAENAVAANRSGPKINADRLAQVAVSHRITCSRQTVALTIVAPGVEGKTPLVARLLPSAETRIPRR